MAGRYLTDLAGWLRAAGLNVVEYSGWQTRARSSGGFPDGRPWGVMWHHTASSTSPQNDASYMCNGSPDRPIANLLIARDGAVWVLAAGATNTNGKGGPWSRWSRGTVPADAMNTHAVGIEIANAGTGDPYPEAQVNAAFGASIAIVSSLGLDPADVCQHYDYAPTRKIDPARASSVQGPWQPGTATSSGTWVLGDLINEHRRRASNAVGPGPGPAPEEDDDVKLYVVQDTTGKVWVTDAFATFRTYVPNLETLRDGIARFGWVANPDGSAMVIEGYWAELFDNLDVHAPEGLA